MAERTNYAAAECGARILETSSGARGAHALLQPHNRDAYTAFLCSAPEKYVVLELCTDVRVDELVLAASEPFAALPKDVAAYARRGAADAWAPLGAWTLAHSRRAQAVRPAGEGAYVRQLRIDMRAFYGAEHYCVLSSLRVHGHTMLEDFEAGGPGDAEHALGGRGPYALGCAAGGSLCLVSEAAVAPGRGGEDANVFRRIHERIARLERTHRAEMGMVQRVISRVTPQAPVLLPGGGHTAALGVTLSPLALLCILALHTVVVAALVASLLYRRTHAGAPSRTHSAPPSAGPLSPVHAAGPLLMDDAQAANVIDASFGSLPSSPRNP